MRLISRDTMYYSLHYSVSNVQKLMDCFSFSRYKAFVLHLDIHYYVYIYRKYHVFKKGNLIYNLERRQQKKSCSQKCNSDQATTRVKSASFASQTVSSSQGQSQNIRTSESQSQSVTTQKICASSRERKYLNSGGFFFLQTGLLHKLLISSKGLTQQIFYEFPGNIFCKRQSWSCNS